MPDAGWYPDPSRQAAYRWWDGTGWTSHVSGPSAPGQARGRDPGALVAQEVRTARWARMALIAYAVTTLVTVAITVPLLRGIGETFRTIMTNPEIAADPATFDPFFGVSPALVIASQAVSPVQLAALIVVLVWVHQAASAAAALGVPARRSPGWAVGAWFIPVVNLWWPCQSLRDLLPPGHPTRELILRLWLLAVTGGVLTLVGTIATLATPSAAVVYAAGAAAIAVAVVVGRRVVTEVGATHQRLAAG